MIVLLPAQTRYEQRGGGTSTSTERRIRFSPEIPGHPTIGESEGIEIPGLVAVSAKPRVERCASTGFIPSDSRRDGFSDAGLSSHQ